MSRDIKFRGLTDTEAPTWVYGSLVNNMWLYAETSKYKKGTPVCEIITGEYSGDCWEDVVEYGETMVTVIPESVGQFIGRKDKNGTDIYDGDIVRTDIHGKTWEVKWVDTIYTWIFDRVGQHEWHTIAQYSKMLDAAFAGIEVIGNIHQHPHLLNQQTKNNNG